MNEMEEEPNFRPWISYEELARYERIKIQDMEEERSQRNWGYTCYIAIKQREEEAQRGEDE